VIKDGYTQVICVQGFVMNLQPSEAEAGFDIRIPPLGDVEDLQRHIDEDWAPASRNFTYSV
jgi:aminoacylase